MYLQVGSSLNAEDFSKAQHRAYETKTGIAVSSTLVTKGMGQTLWV